MSVWSMANGELAESFSGPAVLIPDGSSATAVLKGVRLGAFKENTFFKLTWILASGEYKGFEVNQTIDINNASQKKAMKHANMLAKLFELALIPKPQQEPTIDDMQRLTGKLAGLHIQEYAMVDDMTGQVRKGNWISAIKTPDSTFETKTGIKLETDEKTVAVAKPVEKKPEFDDTQDLPF